ncbi:cytochrome P450 [Streptomyces sp. NPDC090025]|uniref:cytochrome P450 family protein n=1 Tax=Streptomyces sp. NPDC090025 TaxID=3365922 RepID=UPI0038390D14
MASTDRITLDPTGADILAETARLRALGPVVPVELPGGIPAWAPTGYDTLKALILDPDVSRDARQHWNLWPQFAEHPNWGWLRSWCAVDSMLATYGDYRARLRALVAPSFTKRRTEALRPRVDEVSAELLTGLESRDHEVVDLIEGLAYPLPMRVIFELFGVPDHLLSPIRKLMNAVIRADDPVFIDEQRKFLSNALVAYRTENPGDDMTTELIRARDDQGAPLTEEELMNTLMLVIGAGFETTVNLIGNAIVALLRDPDQLVKVREGKVEWDAVIEETLRAHPPLAAMPLRFAVRDVTVADVTIPAGDAIITTFGAAGWDPHKYGPDAGLFDATRGADDHLAFGVGVHRCIGAPLARMEARTVLPALFDRFPDMTLAVEPEQLRQMASFIAVGWQEIPVRLRG